MKIIAEIEITRHNVTPAQFLAYVRYTLKKNGVRDSASDLDLEYFTRGNDLNFDIKYTDPENDPCKAEKSVSHPYEMQTFVCNWDGSRYNEICEFQFDNDTTGTGYYYLYSDEPETPTDTNAAPTAQKEEEKTMSNKPQSRINSEKSIQKAITTCKAYQAPENPAIHISGGNAKLGAIMNISLPPVVTCHNCSSCKNYCYAVRTYNRFTGTAAGWNENLALFQTDPARYFNEISKAVKTQRFFRWHVSGDIVNGEYFAGMIRVAQENPKVEFLAFTKAYQIVNAAIAAGAVIPGNLHLLFSAAPGVDMPNPYRIPECHINFADPALNTYCGGAEYVYHCTGNCTECAINGCGCFFLKSGDITLIDQH